MRTVKVNASYLTATAQTRLLQARPDALDAAGVFRVRVCVAAHALMLLHERIVHQTYRNMQAHTHASHRQADRISSGELRVKHLW